VFGIPVPPGGALKEELEYRTPAGYAGKILE